MTMFAPPAPPHRLLLAALALLASISSGPVAAQETGDTAAVQAATSAASVWLVLVDQGKYDQSWEAAAPAFRAAVTKTAWALALTKARGPLEPFGGRTLLGAKYVESLPNAPPGPYVVIQFRTNVAGGREVVETVTPMRTPDGSWKVSGYFVRPTS
jgi:Protein of unknown function (DUF4019)